MQLKEGGAIEVDEVVAVTMGPERAERALRKAVSLGADRSVHLTDDALAGSDVNGTGYALAKVLAAEAPDLVLLGQQSDDGECYTIGAVVADHLQMPSLTQVIKIDVEDGKLRCERQAEYGYDTVLVELPAVISVGDAINEPRYPSLKAIMGAKKKPLETLRRRRRRHRGRPRRLRQRPRPLQRLRRAAGQGGRARSSRTRTPTRRSSRSSRGWTRGSCWHERDPGLRAALRRRVQQELARRRLRGRSPGGRARHRVPRDRRRRQGRPARRPGAPRSAPTAPRRSSASRAPRASRSRSSTRWRRSIAGQRPRATRCSAAACSASRSAPAWPRGWTPASAWRSPRSAWRTASSSPSARSCRTRRSPTCTTAPSVGVIIGRLNAFETKETGSARPRSRTSTSSSPRTR